MICLESRRSPVSILHRVRTRHAAHCAGCDCTAALHFAMFLGACLSGNLDYRCRETLTNQPSAHATQEVVPPVSDRVGCITAFIAHMIKQYAQRHVVGVIRRVVQGGEIQIEALLQKTQEGDMICQGFPTQAVKVS
jgi:hypothetical protein